MNAIAMPAVKTASPDITFDLATASLRELNAALHKATGESNARNWRVLNPNGRHAVAAGIAQKLLQ